MCVYWHPYQEHQSQRPPLVCDGKRQPRQQSLGRQRFCFTARCTVSLGMCISRMRKPALHWMLPMQKHKVTHLSLMKGATTNCEANEWLSLWVRLTSFDSPIPSSYARQKKHVLPKQTLPIDRAKKKWLDPPTQAQFTTYFT